jgi:hypothetical protein
METIVNKLGLVVAIAICINFILTLPQFIAFFTMDINTGHYYGLVYPFWLNWIFGITSGLLSNFIVKKYIK